MRRWQWGDAAQACGAARLDRDAARDLLAGKWIAFVGDSISRNLCVALLRMLGADASAFSFQRHSDFNRTLPGGVSVSFHWRPFPENATALVSAWRHEKKPAVVIATTALWHMLYYTDDVAYRTRLSTLATATRDMLPKLPNVPKPLMVLATGSELHEEHLTSPAKRAAMTQQRVDAYNKAVQAAGVLAPEGPYGMLDLFSMTHGELGWLWALCLGGRCCCCRVRGCGAARRSLTLPPPHLAALQGAG